MGRSEPAGAAKSPTSLLTTVGGKGGFPMPIWLALSLHPFVLYMAGSASAQVLTLSLLVRSVSLNQFDLMLCDYTIIIV